MIKLSYSSVCTLQWMALHTSLKMSSAQALVPCPCEGDASQQRWRIWEGIWGESGIIVSFINVSKLDYCFNVEFDCSTSEQSFYHVHKFNDESKMSSTPAVGSWWSQLMVPAVWLNKTKARIDTSIQTLVSFISCICKEVMIR